MLFCKPDNNSIAPCLVLVCAFSGLLRPFFIKPSYFHPLSVLRGQTLIQSSLPLQLVFIFLYQRGVLSQMTFARSAKTSSKFLFLRFSKCSNRMFSFSLRSP